VELRALRRLSAEGVGSTCRPGGEDGPVFARRVTEWQAEHLLRNRELVDDAVARTTPEGLSGSEVAAPLWERAPEAARAREAALLWARVQFLTEAIADALLAAGPPAPRHRGRLAPPRLGQRRRVSLRPCPTTSSS